MKYTYSALFLALILLVGMLINLFASFNNEANKLPARENPRYHFVIITQDNNDPFWTKYKKGASEAGAKRNVFVEFVDIKYKDPEIVADAVERAILSDVDGIAIKPFDVKSSTEILQKAGNAGIKTLTYENDVFYIPELPTVGSNSYEVGFASGEMAAAASDGKANIAVIVNNPGIEDSKQYNNIRLQGLLEAISKYPDMEVKQIYTLDIKMFEVDKLTTAILTENPEIDLIVCSDSENTPGVAQVVIDSGKVGDIKIIGYGAMPQTMGYINDGVMYGTITADSYSIGYNTVMQLGDLCEGKQISEFYNTDIYTFNADNLHEYREIFENNDN
jgi:ribose transport system substrate-binding protein